MNHETLIFENEGIQNTEATLDAAAKRARKLGINQLVVATTTGGTALACAERMQDLKIAAVTMHAIDREIRVMRHGEKLRAKDPALMEKARRAGVQFYTGVHPFRGAVSSALHEALGGYSAHDVLAHSVMHWFSTGMKVAIECSLMAADGGLLDVSRDAIALGGYRGGADTAVVLKPAYSYRMFELKIREILAFPRERTGE